jgi:MoxR-like ATPase
MTDWKIFRGTKDPDRDLLATLPPAPPWRRAGTSDQIREPDPELDLEAEASRAAPFRPTEPMILAVNIALYLRRPLLLTGRPGVGKSTLISKVADELMLGPVLRWPITSRATVRGGIYEYDAVGRLQAGKGADPPVEDYLTLGPLGTALVAKKRPRALLIDELDKSDLDFANDLLNLIEEGEYDIPELQRLNRNKVQVKDRGGRLIDIEDGRLRCGHFPFIVMTSNGEREFPAPFLRRCVRLTIEPPNPRELAEIVTAHLGRYLTEAKHREMMTLVDKFVADRQQNELSTDQLLNSVFLTVAMKGINGRSFSPQELKQVRETLGRPLAGAGT